MEKITKAEKAILKNIEKYNGTCHAGTISQDTGYKFKTVKRYIKKLIEAGKIENEPCQSTGKDCFYIIK